MGKNTMKKDIVNIQNLLMAINKVTGMDWSFNLTVYDDGYLYKVIRGESNDDVEYFKSLESAMKYLNSALVIMTEEKV